MLYLLFSNFLAIPALQLFSFLIRKLQFWILSLVASFRILTHTQTHSWQIMRYVWHVSNESASVYLWLDFSTADKLSDSKWHNFRFWVSKLVWLSKKEEGVVGGGGVGGVGGGGGVTIIIRWVYRNSFTNYFFPPLWGEAYEILSIYHWLRKDCTFVTLTPLKNVEFLHMK